MLATGMDKSKASFNYKRRRFKKIFIPDHCIEYCV
jgi:hypothetical protein